MKVQYHPAARGAALLVDGQARPGPAGDLRGDPSRCRSGTGSRRGRGSGTFRTPGGSIVLSAPLCLPAAKEGRPSESILRHCGHGDRASYPRPSKPGPRPGPRGARCCGASIRRLSLPRALRHCTACCACMYRAFAAARTVFPLTIGAFGRPAVHGGWPDGVVAQADARGALSLAKITVFTPLRPQRVLSFCEGGEHVHA